MDFKRPEADKKSENPRRRPWWLRFLDARDHHLALRTFYGLRPFLSGRVVDQLTKASHAALDGGSSGEPEVHLEDAEFDRDTPTQLLAERRSAITRERLRRQRRNRAE